MADVKLDQKFVDYLKKNREMWKSFGKMNSHLYRGMLMKKMEEKKLSSEAKVMIWAMSSIIKSQPRIVQAMTDLPEPERFADPTTWFAVRSFFETECTQYVSESKKSKKFPVVNIPTTMPGLDILFFCLTTENEERTLDALKVRPTFTQMSLEADVQTIARQGYEIFWTTIVKGTRNKDKVEAPAMNESFYNTSAGDLYKLIKVSKEGLLEEIKPTKTSGLYTKEEVESYLRSFDSA